MKVYPVDHWGFPAETLALGMGDCDDSAVLLTSLLRNFLPEDRVFATAGLFGRVGGPRVGVGLQQRRLRLGGHPGRGPARVLGHPRGGSLHPLPALQRPAGGGGLAVAQGLTLRQALKQRGPPGGGQLLPVA